VRGTVYSVLMKIFRPSVGLAPVWSPDLPCRAALGLVVLVALAAPACNRWYSTTPSSECRWPDWPAGAGGAGPANLAAVKPYRNYLAVSRVEPFAEHFTIWQSDGFTRVRVVRDASGSLVFESEGEAESWGGSARTTPPAMSDESAAVMAELEAALRRHCSWVPAWDIEYKGRYRQVTVQEFIALGTAGDGRGTVEAVPAWFATYQLKMDESLRRVLGTLDTTSGLSLGTTEIGRDAQWLAIPPGNGMKLVLVNDGPKALVSEIGEAAQRFARGARGPALASLVPADAPMLPPGFVPRVVVKVTLVGVTHKPPSVVAEVRIPIELHDAVFGSGASGDAEATLSGERYRLHAALTPEAPRAPIPGRSDAKFAGALILRVEDEHDHAWEHTYPVHGGLDLEGDSVVAPWGVGLPGASSRSPEADALRGQLPGLGPFSTVDLRVDISTYVDPRRD
jgi:hypothetical protein